MDGGYRLETRRLEVSKFEERFSELSLQLTLRAGGTWIQGRCKCQSRHSRCGALHSRSLGVDSGS